MVADINKELDTAHLKQVYGDDANIMSLIFDAFVSDSYVRWVELKNVLTVNDLKEAANIVHGLKPSFPMAGMTWLKPKVEEFERQIKASAPLETLWNHYNTIDEELTRLIPILIAEAERLGKL
ncbi:Hpt domain-containing protein [Dyadobacter tibetensis]|uniref:Hpt domain-containing protein n=1 Tax=Dyadobacter tibetensis TaxID=1211851 RepID=UPI000471BBCB|nr:Hpt domain-containing protein [Dyadobacter tibetensis]